MGRTLCVPMASYYTDEGIGQTMQGRLLDSLTHSQDPSQKNETGLLLLPRL
jgi:hypothetical protein